MTANVAPGHISNAARTQGEVKTDLEQIVSFSSEHLGAAAETTLMISAGSIVPTAVTGNIFKVDTAGGAANLNNITTTNVPDGRLVLLRGANPGANLVTLVNNAGGAGQIALATSASLVLKAGVWLLIKRTGSNWEEVLRYYGQQTADQRAFFGSAANTRFTSSDQSIAFNSVLTVPHSLGAQPKRIWFTLINVTAQFGWSTGDEVDIRGQVIDGAGSVKNPNGCCLYADATNVNCVIGAAIAVFTKTTGADNATITAANWKIRIYAEP